MGNPGLLNDSVRAFAKKCDRMINSQSNSQFLTTGLERPFADDPQPSLGHTPQDLSEGGDRVVRRLFSISRPTANITGGAVCGLAPANRRQSTPYGFSANFSALAPSESSRLRIVRETTIQAADC